MLIVQICDFGSDGDAHYRLHDPSRQMSKLPGVTAIDCHFFSHYLPDLANIADVLVLQFVNDWDLLSLCLRRRAAGKITIFEANDFFFDLQSWNPIAPQWYDRNNQELYLQLLATADGVQTSSEELARRWRQRGARQVAVFRNHLTSVPPLPAPADRPLTIGWAGSPGHLGDWYFIAPVLQRWLAAHPEVKLAVMTDEPGRAFFQLPPDRYRFEPFGSLDSYLRFLEGIDIGLAPLLPTGYNRCRSDVKFLEYASRGVAGIYADLEPYRASVIPGKTGLLYQTPAQLIEHLDLLHTDIGLRHSLRREGYQYVTGRLIGNHVAERIEWYKSLMQAPPQPTPLPQEIAAESVREGRYIQVPPGPAQRTLTQAISKAPSPQTVKELTGLIETHPRYLIALQHLAKILNSQDDHRGAMACLQRASALRPDDPRTLSEMGRTWFLLKDVAQARKAMEQALHINPHYLPAWQYQLRLLSWHPGPDALTWSQRAEALFPACYPIALLGARTYPRDQVPQVVHRLLDQHVPTLPPDERPTALAAFREAIALALKGAPASSAVLPLLRRACDLFPESGYLAGELGAALYQAGRADEAFDHQARALALRRQGEIIRSENERNAPAPLAWRLAQHIRGAQEEDVKT